MAEGVSVKPRPLMPQSARCYARLRTGSFSRCARSPSLSCLLWSHRPHWR